MLAEFILKTNYPSETDNSSRYKFGAKTNYGAEFVSKFIIIIIIFIGPQLNYI